MSNTLRARRYLRRTAASLVAVVGVALIVGSILVGLGVLDPSARWFGLFGQEQAEAEAKSLRPADTASDGATAAPQDLIGTTMNADDGEYPTGEQIARMRIGEAGRFQSPSLGMDVPLNSMSTVDGVATPPGFRSAYLLRDHGVSPADAAAGTTYVVMHSAMKTGFAPGNYLVDKRTGTSKVPEGTVVSVDGVEYAITGHRNVLKTELPSDAEVWDEGAPGRLVIITCQQMNGARTTHNTVFFAERI